MQSELYDTATPITFSTGFPDKLVFLDVETTGGKSTYHRIIEIGALIVEQGELKETWHRFINPDVVLPDSIQKLTGIKPEDLEYAPTFDTIADELLSILNNRVLVAHNARFDYGFLKNEFKRVGLSYQTKPLCSVKLSRALYPQFKRHSLDQLIRRFNLRIHERHRAFDDAKAVYDFFLKTSALFDEDEIASACNSIRQKSALPMHLDAKEVDALPKSAGVYYFYDSKGKLLYIGKSVNLKARVMSHFTQDYNNPKDLKMSAQIASIEFDHAPSDFGAQLLESRQIKNLSPLYNHRLRKVKKLFQYVVAENTSGFKVVTIQAVEVEEQRAETAGLFRSRRQAMKILERMADQYQLCHRLLGLENAASSQPACFRYQLKKCLGACCQQESAERYNQRLQEALAFYTLRMWPWPSAVLVEERPSVTMQDTVPTQYHLIDQWQYIAKLDQPYELYDLGWSLKSNSLKSNQSLGENNRSNPVSNLNPEFDLDTYFILSRFLADPQKAAKLGLNVHELEAQSSDE